MQVNNPPIRPEALANSSSGSSPSGDTDGIGNRLVNCLSPDRVRDRQLQHAQSKLAKSRRDREKKKKKKQDSIARAEAVLKTSIQSHAISISDYRMEDYAKLEEEVPAAKIKEFLSNIAVSGMGRILTLRELILVDDGRLLCCWLSAAGSAEKELIGMRTVGYFAPFKAAVINLTVILSDHRTNKNLDPMNKVSSIYVYVIICLLMLIIIGEYIYR